MKFNPQKWKISSSYNRIRRHNSLRDSHYDGHVVTEYGIVSVYSDINCSCLEFVNNRRHYYQSFEGGLNERQLMIRATKFARFCIEQSLV